MGTRNLVAVVIDGEFKVAQYGQWDGYFDGQGSIAVKFIRRMLEASRLDEFKKKVRACQWVSSEEIETLYQEVGAEKGAQWIGMDVARKFTEKHPHLSRDAGAGILSLILESTGGLALKDSRSFAADSLFCEFGYVLDLDDDQFEVYVGGSKSPHTSGRFHSMGPETPAEEATPEYYPIKLLRTFALSEIPGNWKTQVNELMVSQES